jgi:hypothetical protein
MHFKTSLNTPKRLKKSLITGMFLSISLMPNRGSLKTNSQRLENSRTWKSIINLSSKNLSQNVKQELSSLLND